MYYLQFQVINFDSPRGGVNIKTHSGEWTTSYLLIQGADIADSGNYTCAPSNAGRTSAKVHVFLHGKYFILKFVSLLCFRLQFCSRRNWKMFSDIYRDAHDVIIDLLEATQIARKWRNDNFIFFIHSLIWFGNFESIELFDDVAIFLNGEKDCEISYEKIRQIGFGRDWLH